jgi:hypothetical protein
MGTSVFLLPEFFVIANEELLYKGMKPGIISSWCWERTYSSQHQYVMEINLQLNLLFISLFYV